MRISCVTINAPVLATLVRIHRVHAKIRTRNFIDDRFRMRVNNFSFFILQEWNINSFNMLGNILLLEKTVVYIDLGTAAFKIAGFFRWLFFHEQMLLSALRK